MVVRVVRREVEATLATPGGEAAGKSEYKVYGNGERRLTVRILRLDAAAGQTATVAISGREVVRLTTTGGGFLCDRRSGRGDSVPEPREGESVEVRVNGALVMTGVYRPD